MKSLLDNRLSLKHLLDHMDNLKSEKWEKKKF